MIRNIRFILSCFKLNVKKEWQYKTSFWTQILLMVLNNFSIIGFFAILFTITDDVGGMGFDGLCLLFAISAAGYGVMQLFFYGATEMKDIIYDARLDVYLTQPKSLLLNISCSSTSISAIGDILTGFICLVIVGAAWWWYPVFVLIAIISGLVYFGMHVFWHTFAFYIKGGNALAKIAEDTLLKASMYPKGIYNNVVKILFMTALPVFLFTFIPAENVLLDFNIWNLLVYLGGTIIWLFLAFTFFRISVRRYNSGSVMGGRY